MRSCCPSARTLAASAALLAIAASPLVVTAQGTQPNPPSRADAAGAPVIRVTLLGTGTPRPIMARFGPSILVEAGREKLVIDAGRGAYQRLTQLGVSYADITAVLLTHLHSDHIVGLPDLWLTGWLVARADRPLELWGPAGTSEMAGHLEAAFAFDRAIRVTDDRAAASGGRIVAHDIVAHDTGEQAIFERNGVKVTAFLVDHGLVKPALGYRVDYAGHSVVLSGDTRPSPALIRAAHGTDLLIHEVAFASDDSLAANAQLRGILAHHSTPAQAGEVFTAVRPKLAAFSHIVLRGNASTTDIMRLARTTYYGPLVVGADLMRFEIGRNVTIQGNALDDVELRHPSPPAP
jgi:ribonuclease Z